jgi:seryl-tRNA synthetase
MLPTATLARAGYLDTAYQHLNFVSPLDHRPEIFDRFHPYWSNADDMREQRVDGIRSFLAAPADVLNPALCLHCYPMMQGVTVASDRPVGFTLAGSCFRDESGNLNNRERLREFLMRESVFIGSRESLDRIHGEVLYFLTRLAVACGLPFRLEHASDIFFSDAAPQRLFSQMLSDNKIELIVPQSGDGKPVAVASLNRHDNHFTKSFGVTTSDGDAAASLCVGVGIDRLVLSVMSQAEKECTPPLLFLQRSLAAYVSLTPDAEESW